jgi:PAS domain-containing protein
MEPLSRATQVSTDQGRSTLKECVKRHNYEVQSGSPAIYICDRDGYIKFYNKAAVTLWGRTPEIGKDLWCGSYKIFTPDGMPTSFEECPMAKTMKQGISIRGQEIMIERPDGMRLNVMPHPDPIFDSTGEVVGAINVLVDITATRDDQRNQAIVQPYS